MSEPVLYVKEGQPDRLANTPAQKVHLEFEGYRAVELSEEAREPEHAARRGRPPKAAE